VNSGKPSTSASKYIKMLGSELKARFIDKFERRIWFFGPTRVQTSADSAVRILSGFTVRCLWLQAMNKFQSWFVNDSWTIREQFHVIKLSFHGRFICQPRDNFQGLTLKLVYKTAGTRIPFHAGHVECFTSVRVCFKYYWVNNIDSFQFWVKNTE